MTDEPILLTKAMAMKILGLGEKAFDKLQADYILPPGSRRKRYLREDLIKAVEAGRITCRIKEKARRTTGTISVCGGKDIEVLLKPQTSPQHKP